MRLIVVTSHNICCLVVATRFTLHRQATIVVQGIAARGVLTPVLPEIYNPGLDRLAAEGLAFEENEL